MKLIFNKQIKDPKQTAVKIEIDVWRKLRYLAIDRGEEVGHNQHGLSVLAETALQEWLVEEEQKAPIQKMPEKAVDPRRVVFFLERDTVRRLKRIAVDRDYPMASIQSLIREALDWWFLEKEKMGR